MPLVLVSFESNHTSARTLAGYAQACSLLQPGQAAIKVAYMRSGLADLEQPRHRL